MTTSMDLWKHIFKQSRIKNNSVGGENSKHNKSNTGMINRFIIMESSSNNTNYNNNNNTILNYGNLNYKPANKISYQAVRVSISPNRADRDSYKNIKQKEQHKGKDFNQIKIKSTSPFRNSNDSKVKFIVNKSINIKTNVNIKSPKNISPIPVQRDTSKSKLKSLNKKINNPNSNRQKFPLNSKSPYLSLNNKNECSSFTKRKEQINNFQKLNNLGTLNTTMISNKALTPNNKNGINVKTRNPSTKKEVDLRKTHSPLSMSSSGNFRQSLLNSSKINNKPKKIFPPNSKHDSIKNLVKDKPKSPIILSGSTVKVKSYIPLSNKPQSKKKFNFANQNSQKPGFDDQVIKNPTLNQKNASKLQQSSSTICTLSVSSKSTYTTKKVSQISHISKTGYAGVGVQKFNQDSYFICNFDNINYWFIGVCDGHGANGHFVSSYLKEFLPKIIQKELNDKIKKLQQSNNTNFLHKIIENSFILTNSKLSNNVDIDTNFSGSTCISLLLSKDILISANVGDSRAIKGIFCSHLKQWSYEVLSRDHKASEVDEERRIIRFGGRIEQFREEDGSHAGPKRVWLQKEQIPGLAMTRSFGDQIASSVGVICEPEIRDFHWKEEDKFVIIASDGLWEYMTNKEVINITEKYYCKKDSEGACDGLYKTALKKWMENDSIIDDITIIVIFLE